MILTKAQAEAVYSAMCALHDVGGDVDLIKFDDRKAFTKFEYGGGYGISVGLRTVEQYASLGAFAAAYGLKA